MTCVPRFTQSHFRPVQDEVIRAMATIPLLRTTPLKTKVPLKKVVFLSQYFYPEENATSEMLTGIAIALKQKGFEVEAVSGFPSYHRNQRTRSPDEKEKVKMEAHIYKEMRIHRIWSTTFHRSSFLGRALNALSFSVFCLFRSFSFKNDSLFIPVTNPPSLMWIAWILNRIKGSQYLILIHDVYPEIAEAVGVIRINSLFSKLWNALNKKALSRAKTLVVLGRDMKIHYQQKFKLLKMQPRPIQIIHNWADGELIRPQPKSNSSLTRKWPFQNRFILQYSGNIGRFHGIESVFNIAKELNPEKFGVAFIGQGHLRGWLEAQIKESQLTHIVLEPFQPRTQLNDSLSACDLAIVSMLPNTSGLCVPSKLYGILASGRPVLAIVPEDSEVAHLVLEYEFGVVTSPTNPQKAVEAIHDLSQNPLQLEKMGQQARKTFEDHFTRAHAVERWSQLFRNIGVTNSKDM